MLCVEVSFSLFFIGFCLDRFLGKDKWKVFYFKNKFILYKKKRRKVEIEGRRERERERRERIL